MLMISGEISNSKALTVQTNKHQTNKQERQNNHKQTNKQKSKNNIQKTGKYLCSAFLSASLQGLNLYLGSYKLG